MKIEEIALSHFSSVSQFSSVQLCREIGRARARQTVPLSGPRRVPGEAIRCKGPRYFRHCRNPRLYPALRPRPGSSRNREIALSHFSSVQFSQSVQFSSVQFSSVQFSYAMKQGGPELGRRAGPAAPLCGSRRVPRGCDRGQRASSSPPLPELLALHHYPAPTRRIRKPGNRTVPFQSVSQFSLFSSVMP